MLSVKTPKGTLSFGYSRDYIDLRSCGLTEVPIELKGEHFSTLYLNNWCGDGRMDNKIKKLPVWLCANEKLMTIIFPDGDKTTPLLRKIPFHLHPQCCIYQGESSRAWPASKLYNCISSMTHISVIADRATEICVALQELGLPAYVTYIILEEYFPPNSIRMWAKWELITAVKHFHDRRSINNTLPAVLTPTAQ
jgi:hypothetical protein